MPKVAIVVLSALAVVLNTALAFAQTDTAATVTTDAPIYLRPGAAVPLRVAAVGTRLRVLKEEGEWVEVEFNDPQHGRRVGWLEMKLVRLTRPELRPLDLSIRDASVPGPPPSAPAAPPQLPSPDAGSALKPQVREGFWFNVGMGFGSLGCEDCIGREDGLSGGLSLGGAIGDRVLLGVGTTGFAKDVAGDLLTVGTLDARVRVYPVRTSGFFINAGAGLGTLSYAGDSEVGLGMMLGVGWDIRLGRNVSLTPFWNGFAMANSNVDANVGQLGVGVTIH